MPRNDINVEQKIGLKCVVKPYYAIECETGKS